MATYRQSESISLILINDIVQCIYLYGSLKEGRERAGQDEELGKMIR